MKKRTDLISEIIENQKGIRGFRKDFGHAEVTVTDINSELLSRTVNRPLGLYCTVKFENLLNNTAQKEIISAVIYCLNLLTDNGAQSVLCTGLGNPDITPDALGPLTADRIIATRHIKHSLLKDRINVKSVAVIIPSVEGKTGIKSKDVIFCAAEKIKPDVIFAIDALAAKNYDGLFKSIQLTNSGILPASGVNKKGYELSKNTVNIPVISLGVPTVCDFKGGMVTPKDVDVLVRLCAEIISSAVNKFLTGTERL